MDRYDDILRLPRPISKKRPRMSNANRAKQFMPFAALRGYGDAIAERETVYVARSILSEEDAMLLDEALRSLSEALRRGERPEVTVEYFAPREGAEDAGQLLSFTGRLERIAPEEGLVRVNGRSFGFGEIMAIGREDEA